MDDIYGEKTFARFQAKIQVDEKGCWIWTSTLNNKGYARLFVNRHPLLMHRWAYVFYKGPIPNGLELDHLCRVPRCVNPDHMEPVTHRENNLRGETIAAKHAKTMTCPQGHPYDGENTYTSPKGSRECRACKREKAHPRQKTIKARLTHCPQGHPYDGENTGTAKNGKRYCKACSSVLTPTYHRNNARKGA